MKRKAKTRITRDPNCDCENGWRWVTVIDRFGLRSLAVTRCSCVRMERIEKPKKMGKKVLSDRKSQAAGE